MPVIWHQLVLSFCQLYRNSLDEMQKEALKSLIKKKKHHLITPEIIKALDNTATVLKDNVKELKKENNIEFE